MEADWSAEVGADLPHISVPWEGFLDLRRAPDLIDTIEEVREIPAFAAALLQLNQPGSSVMTSKCDCWRIGPDEIDSWEFDADSSNVLCGFATYVDLLALDGEMFCSFQAHEGWVRKTVDALRLLPLRSARIELVIRGADLFGREGFALTAYITGCGADQGLAMANWQSALTALLPVLAAAADNATMA